MIWKNRFFYRFLVFSQIFLLLICSSIKGYAVIEGVASPEQCEELRSLWEKHRKQLLGFKDWPISNKGRRSAYLKQFGFKDWPKGMVLEECVAQSSAAWNARMIALPYFAALWGTGDLLTSFDRVNAARAGMEQTPEWMHTDQSGSLEGFACVQGYLDINGTTEFDGGLRVATRSHNAHFDLLHQWGKVKKNHWYLLSSTERAHVLQHYPPRKVVCAPGSLVLWDSRLFHDNVSPASKKDGGKDRLVFYICMMPRHVAQAAAGETGYQRLIETRKRVFMQRLATPHWPILPGVFGNLDDLQPRINLGQPELTGIVRALTIGGDDVALNYEGEPLLVVKNPQQLYPEQKWRAKK